MTRSEKTLKSLLGVLVAILIVNTTAAFAQTMPIDKSITLKPKNSAGLQLNVNQHRECSYPDIPCITGTPLYSKSYTMKNHEEYSDGEGYDRMAIVSEALVVKKGAREHRKSLNKLKDFLSGSFSPNYTALDKFERYSPDMMRVFDDCTDYGCPSISELPVSTADYPETQAVKAIMTMDGQDLIGEPRVRVYAKKGSQYIQLDGSLDIKLSDVTKSCESLQEQAYRNDDASKALVQCVEKAIKNNETLQNIAKQKVQELTKTFAL